MEHALLSKEIQFHQFCPFQWGHLLILTNLFFSIYTLPDPPYLHLSMCRIGSSLWPLSSTRVPNPFCITNMARFSFTAKTFNYLFPWLLCQIRVCHHSLRTKIFINEARLRTTSTTPCDSSLSRVFLSLSPQNALFPHLHMHILCV